MRMSREDVYNSEVLAQGKYGLIVKTGLSESGMIYIVYCQDDTVTTTVNGDLVDTYTI